MEPMSMVMHDEQITDAMLGSANEAHRRLGPGCWRARIFAVLRTSCYFGSAGGHSDPPP